MAHGRYDLTEFEWKTIQPLLPNKPRGVPRVDDRRVLNGIFFILRSGMPWADLPERYGPYTTIYNRFNRWRKAGVWDRLMDAVIAAHEAKGQKLQMIDSTSVRVHQQAAAQKKQCGDYCIGRSRGGLTSKIHLRVNEFGLPLQIELSAGQMHDCASGGTSSAGLAQGHQCPGRPRIRCRLDQGDDRRSGLHTRHSSEIQQARSHPVLEVQIQEAQPCRTLHQQAQTVPSLRHTIRPQGFSLFGFRKTRCRQIVASLL